MSTTSRHALFAAGFLGLSLLSGACAEDEGPTTLFDETGVWSLINYDLDGSGDLKEVDSMNRRDAFMLSFDPAENVVTSASCVESENDTPATSSCLLTPDNTDWVCRCYAYDFKDDQMLWQEFDAGDIPPVVDLDVLDEEPVEGEPANDELGTPITVAEIPDVNSTYNFRPLPDGLFGSNGDNSRFIFQARAGSVFNRAFEDDRRDTCEPCIP